MKPETKTTVRDLIAQTIKELKDGMLGVQGQQARYRYIEFLLEDIEDLSCECNEDQIYSVFIENDYDFKHTVPEKIDAQSAPEPKFPAFDKNGKLDGYIEEMLFDFDGPDQEMVDKLKLLGYDKETIIRIFNEMEYETDFDTITF